MRYVIIGAGAAGITAAKTLRQQDPQGGITVVSLDEQVHSRCMLHHYLSHERDAAHLSFIPEDFFEEQKIRWIQGKPVQGLDLLNKRVQLPDGLYCDYDKLLIATGANSFIPPVGALREAKNVFGLRHLADAQAIDQAAAKTDQAVIIGSGLVGLDAAYGLMKQGKKISIVEMADRILPIQLDEKAAKEYQKLFENAGCKFYLGKKGSDTVCDEQGNVTHLVLDDGQKLACGLVIVAAGVRAAVNGLEDSGLKIDRSIQVDGYLRTSDSSVYAAGDVTGLSGIWPNAQKQGKIAAQNMTGQNFRYGDSFAAKNTINFFGLPSLCVGELQPKQGDEVIAQECQKGYRRVVIRDGKLVGCLLQGEISHAGIYQYLIKNEIFLGEKKEMIFRMNFGDFYGIKENGEYLWTV